MTASEKTVVGFAKQTAQGTPITDDAKFEYMLFREGGLSLANLNVPLDPEVGGGSMDRNIIKAGVIPGGALSFIPRPSSLGTILMGLLGKDTVVHDLVDKVYEHSFGHNTDEFEIPWYTARQAPGQIWGEQYADMRFSSLVLSWRAARFVEGEVALLGAGVPKKVATTTWDPYSGKVDGGPQFIAPLGTIALPTGSKLSVLSGAFAMSLAQPVEDKMVVGSYSPETLDVVHRSYVISLVCRLASDDTMFNKLTLDPAGGSEWLPNLMKEADIDLNFKSYALAGDTKPFSFAIKANGESGAGANVIWTARPLSFRAGRQITMAITGSFVANTVALKTPIAVELVNCNPTY